MSRVRIAVGGSECVHDPGEPAIVANHDVRILIEGKKGRQRRYAIAHVAPHQQTALGVHIVAERQLAEIAAIEGDEDAAQEAAQHDAASALVGREAVRLALAGS